MRFSLVNTHDTLREVRIFFGWQDIIRFYVQGNGSPIELQKVGQLQGWDGKSDILDRHIGLVTLEPNDTVTCWVYYSPIGYDQIYYIDVETVTESRESQVFHFFKRRSVSRLHAASIAVTLFQLIFALGLWVSTRKPAYLSYALYLLFLGLFIHMRYSDYVFWPMPGLLPPMLTLWVYKALPFAGYFFYFRFGSAFLQIPQKEPRLVNWFKAGELLCLTFVVLSLPFLYFPQVQILFYGLISFSVFGIAVYLYSKIIKRREPLAYLLLLGSAVFATGAISTAIITILASIGWLMVDFELDLFLLGMMLELLLFSFALALKFRQDEEEKTQAQQALVEELRQKQALAEKLQGIRNKVARDLHDDIGATLSSIVIYSELARNQKDSTQQLALLDKIAGISQDMSQSMRDTVWAIHPRHDRMDSFVARVEEFAASVLGSKGISFRFVMDDHENERKLGMELRQNLYLICKEAINNVTRHAQATEVFITMHFTDTQITLEIADNGIGLGTNGLNPGNGLKNMEARSQEWGGRMQCLAAEPQGVLLLFTLPLPAFGDTSNRP